MRNTLILTIVLSGKKPIDADYSALTEKIKSKVDDRARITKYKNFLAMVSPEIGQEKYY